MGFWRKVGAIVWKDVLAELRTREMFNSMFVFAALVILTFNFAFELRGGREWLAPGVLWAAFAFAGTLGLNRSFALEREGGGLEGLLLSPTDRSAIYFGKFAGNVVFMSMVEAIILPISIILFNLAWPGLWLLLVIFLGTVGLAGAGTLLAAIAIHTRAREVMLPILLFPVSVPLLIAAVRATRAIMEGLGPAEWFGWVQLLAAFDAILLTIAYMTFDYVMEE